MLLNIIAYLLLFIGAGDTFSSGLSSIAGKVIDSNTNEPVSFAYVHLEEINRTETTNQQGVFELKNINLGTYTLTVHRIGYKTQSQKITIDSETGIQLEIRMEPTIFSSRVIQVVGESAGASNLEHASKKIYGVELRRNLGSTLSQTLSNIPGFDQRTNGPAAGRPVIRGMGDERVLILQDGIRTGDVSAQAGDHAVSIDPISSEEIEIARGPAALAYGANAIGGVVNVVRNLISTNIPSRVNGSFSAGGETVNEQLSGGLVLKAPVGRFALTADVSGRTANDTETPDGKIQNSFFNSTNDAVGLSYVRPWGFIGASAAFFSTEYGIPPDPEGEPEGANIEATKYQFDLKSELLLRNSPFKQLDFMISYKDYTHDEIERAGRGAVGTRFELDTFNASVKTRHENLGFLQRGTMGVWFENEDLLVIGDDTPPSESYKFGAWWTEEMNFGRAHFEGGLRFDYVQNKPDQNNPDSRIGNIRKREYTALSSSIAAFYYLGGGFTVGASMLHSFRAPSLDELFSEGPHLAINTFEVGNPDLDSERGLAKEFIIRYSSNRLNSELTAFHNGFSNFLFARNTGERSIKRNDLFVFQFEGADAELYGFEASNELKLTENLLFTASFTYTKGRRDLTELEQMVEGTTATRGNIPQIPPFKTNLSVKYSKAGYEVGSRLRLAAEQDDVDTFELPTSSYEILDVFAQIRLNKFGYFHTFALNVSNIFDSTYRNHLSLIKELRPEPGRNISLLYRLFF